MFCGWDTVERSTVSVVVPPDDDDRSKVVPVTAVWPLEELITAGVGAGVANGTEAM